MAIAGNIARGLKSLFGGRNANTLQRSSLASRFVKGNKQRQYMRFGNIGGKDNLRRGVGIPNPWRVAKTTAPLLALGASPMLANYSTAMMGGGGTFASRVLGAPHGLKKYSPFGSQQIMGSFGSSGDMMRRGVSGGLSSKNNAISRGATHFNMRSMSQMQSIATNGIRI